jgi:rhodanese-related sulfurtransferase
MPALHIVSMVLIAGFVLFKLMGSRGIVQVNAESAREMVKDPGIVIVDVRTPPEFRGGHIKGAIPIPLAEMGGRIGSLASYRDRQVLVYCLSGNRSMTASRVLRKNGFNRVANMKGGMNAWAGKGFTVVKES